MRGAHDAREPTDGKHEMARANATSTGVYQHQHSTAVTARNGWHTQPHKHASHGHTHHKGARGKARQRHRGQPPPPYVMYERPRRSQRTGDCQRPHGRGWPIRFTGVVCRRSVAVRGIHCPQQATVGFAVALLGFLGLSEYRVLESMF